MGVLAKSVHEKSARVALTVEHLACLLEVLGGFAMVLGLRVLVGIFDALVGELGTLPPSTVQDGTVVVPELVAVVDTPSLHARVPSSSPTPRSASI